jgi:hypothetical protein
MAKALEGGNHLTRNQLVPILEKDQGGVTDGQRMPYLLMYAELEAIICSGPRSGKSHTYALLDERVPPATAAFDRDAALAGLATRYFASHGPATLADFAWWSGLTQSDAKRGLEASGSALTTTEIEGTLYAGPARASRTKVPGTVVHLLPNYDEYLGSYKDYRPIARRVPDAHKYHPALQQHILTVNGEVIGGWKRTLRAKEVDLDLMLMDTPTPAEEAALASAIEDYARFTGRAPGRVRRP